MGGGFSAISTGDTMKVTRQKDLIAPFLFFCAVGLFLFRSLSPFEDLVTFLRNSSTSFFFLISFLPGVVFLFVVVLKIELCLAQ